MNEYKIGDKIILANNEFNQRDLPVSSRRDYKGVVFTVTESKGLLVKVTPKINGYSGWWYSGRFEPSYLKEFNDELNKLDEVDDES